MTKSATNTTRPSRQASRRLEKYGPWALVTGASSGMGREFARQLASEGFSLVITARRIDRLDDLARELTAAHGIEVRAVQADLSDPSDVSLVAKTTEDVDLGLVVNNAGSAAPGAFLAVPLEKQLNVIELNINAAVQLAHKVGGQLKEQGRGGYIFVGSTSAFNGAPYLTNYAASKAYLGSFAEGLRMEWSDHGVDVLVVHPGPTRTEMVEMDGVDFQKVPAAWMDADQVARKTLKALGRRAVLVPGAPNKAMRFMTTRLLPRRASVAMWGTLMRKATDENLL